MAKQVMPPAILEARSDDIDLPSHLLARLAPFSQLKAAPSLDKYPGSCKLRFIRAGEDVCVHGEPGWSAFCFVPAAEVTALGEYAAKAAAEGPANRDKVVAAIAKLEADLQSLRERLGQPEIAKKDKDDLEKKLGSAERELEKQQAALALLDEEAAKLPEVQRRFETWLTARRESLDGVAARQASAAQHLPRLIESARATLDSTRAALLQESADADAVRQRQLADLLEPTHAELAHCLHTLAGADGSERVAVARLPRVRPQPAPQPGWYERFRSWLRGPRQASAAAPAVIPTDCARDLDYQSRLSSLYDGELIGEISCLHRTPRSATVTMARDGFVMELMRNILDQMSKDTAYQGRMAAAQRQRLLNSALRENRMFADLSEAELAMIHRGMEFQAFEPGSMICDEYEEGDCLHVIGSGIVKVITGVSWLLPGDRQIDMEALQQELTAAGASYAEARGELALMFQTADNSACRAVNRILAQHSWRQTAAVRALVKAEGLALRVWSMLAALRYAGASGLVRCNRLLLHALDPQAYAAPKSADFDAQTDDAFRVREFAADWKKLCARLAAGDKKADDPARVAWDRLPASVQECIDRGRTVDLTPADKDAVVAGLNGILREELLLLTPAGSIALTNKKLAGQLLPMMADGQLWSDFAAQRWGRCLNRLVLEVLCPRALGGLPKPSGLPTILAYRSGNEVLGEIALLLNQPRTATLVTYNHPKNDPSRDVGPVHLFKIGKALFDEISARRPELRQRLTEIALGRLSPRPARSRFAGGVDPALLTSPHGEQAGLIEGQRLMLIDLDRCTRCDECVRACVNTHDDGRSRLFLIGERHANYLVPATCRSCLDPVCMIGCPVNSIHRGDSKEILIRDWCIGCGACAEQCPYGSIQMHDIGLVPARTRGWRYQPAPDDFGWTDSDFEDDDWQLAATPVEDDALFDESLQTLPDYQARGAVAFRHLFRIAPNDFQADGTLHLELKAPSDQARVWLNGKELQTAEKQRQGKRKYAIGPAQHFVTPGENTLAVLVPRAAEPTGQPFFTLRLDAERDADNPTVEIKLVTSLAVVCDLCSTLPTGPACVNACPHEAAMRINATTAAVS
jgi:Fe-S-cluster-containing hydrogenase component 2/CRP-like cAMP-binding protein